MFHIGFGTHIIGLILNRPEHYYDVVLSTLTLFELENNELNSFKSILKKYSLIILVQENKF